MLTKVIVSRVMAGEKITVPVGSWAAEGVCWQAGRGIPDRGNSLILRARCAHPQRRAAWDCFGARFGPAPEFAACLFDQRNHVDDSGVGHPEHGYVSRAPKPYGP